MSYVNELAKNLQEELKMAPCEKKLREEILFFDKKEVWLGDDDEATTISYSDSDEGNRIIFRKDLDGSWSVSVEADIDLKPNELLVLKDMCDWLSKEEDEHVGNKEN